MNFLRIGLFCAIGVAIAVMSWLFEENRTRLHHANSLKFTVAANRTAQEIEKTLNLSTSRIKSLVAYFNASTVVLESNLKAFVESAGFFAEGAYIRAVAVMPVLSSRHIAPFETGLSKRTRQREVLGYHPISIKRVDDRDIYAPVVYVASPEGPRGILGYDLASSDVRLKTALEALESADIRITPPVQLSQDDAGTHQSVLVIGATKSGNLGLLSDEPYHDNVPILIASSYTPGAALEAYIETLMDAPFDIAISDITTGSGINIFRSRKGDLPAPLATREISYGGRVWEIRFSPNQAFANQSKQTATVAFFGVGVLLMLVTGFAGSRLISSRITQDQKISDQSGDLNVSQTKLSMHVQNTPIGAITWDRDFRCTEWNKAAENIFGYSFEEVVGRPPTETILPAEIRDELKDYFQVLLRQTEGTRNTNANLTKDGRTITCEWYNKPIIGLDGEVVGITALVQDVSERLEAERQLREAKEAAEKANKAKTEFLAAMSHDLRTPLNAIMGFSEMMRQQTFGPLGNDNYTQYVEDIHSSGTLLVSLINDVLDLSKIEAGKYQLLEQPIDMSDIIDVSLRQVSAMAAAANLTVTPHIQTELPRLIGDERALLQVLNNLISNAVKFTPDGGTVDVHAFLDRNQRIRIDISDTGIGMSENGIAKATAPFEQADGIHSREHDGTGLGLYICLKIMALFGGTLEIESTVGMGTTVHLCFPPERSQIG